MSLFFFFSSRRRHTRFDCDWIQTCALPILTTTLVYEILKPVWEVRTETARRVRQRIEKVLDWAKVLGYRSGEKIGRASCRERVEISVVAVSLKKTERAGMVRRSRMK